MRAAAVCAGVLLSVVACEAEAPPTGPGESMGELALNEIGTTSPLNASSSDTLIHFSFTTGSVVPATGDWDVALRRFEVRLNGGVSGTRGVVGYSVKNNATVTDHQVLAFTAENTRAAFDDIRAPQIPSDASFESDRLVESGTGYLSFAGGPAANPLAYWKVRTSAGGFALVRVTGMTLSASNTLSSLTFESRAQSGATLGAVQQISVPVSGNSAAISFVTNQAVTASGCNWDFEVNAQSFAMSVNTACNVGTYPGPVAPAFSAATTASDAPQYAAFLSGLTGPVPNSVSVSDAPFRYNLEGTNRLHPTFNTYLVKSGARVYKLQLINYYSASGASGWVTLRYARIQ